MCLTNTCTSKEKDELKSKIGKKGRKFYKVVGVKDGQYFPISAHTMIPFVEGLNIADTSEKLRYSSSCYQTYRAGYHCFVTKKEAQTCLDGVIALMNDPNAKARITKRLSRQKFPERVVEEYKLITCVVKKSWIKVLGEQQIVDGDKNDIYVPTIICEKIICPKFRK